MTSIVAPMCMYCLRYNRSGATMNCQAYPDRIPDDIIFSRVDHRKPYAGDHDLQFEQDPSKPTPRTFKFFDGDGDNAA